jgi:hypothetical protein
MENKRGLSGIKDVDLKILSELDDRDLFSFCLADKFVNQMCKNEHFWRSRFVKRFGKKAAIYKPKERNWRNHYLKVIHDISQCSINLLNGRFGSMSWRIDQTPDMVKFNLNGSIENADENIKNCYWLSELGEEITIYYPIDRYREMDFIQREYKSNMEFTPHKILKLIYNFYQEKISREELLKMQEEDIEYSDDYSLEDTEKGRILRIDLMGDLTFFEGLEVFENGYILRLGS